MADILRMIVVLSALCGLSGFALSYLKMVTAPVIEEQVLTYVQGPAIAGVFTDIDNQPIADRKAFETEKGRVLVFPAMRDGKLVGVALEAKGKGYGGDVGVMVGFNVANDTLAGIGTTTLKETPGLGMRIAEPGFTGQFRGIAAPVGLKSQGGSIDGISGATISSSGAVTAVNLAAEAYKAQCVATHCWILSQSGYPSVLGAEPGAAALAAAQEVAHVLVTYNGQVCFTPYFASASTGTASAAEVWGNDRAWLQAVDSPYDQQIATNWNTNGNSSGTARFSRQTLQDRIKDVMDIDLSGVDPNSWFTIQSANQYGWVAKIQVGPDASVGTVSGRWFRENLLARQSVDGRSLRSQCFTVSYNADLDCFIFDVYGYGHGCGMSQWGAIGYARNGWSYRDILTHYFVGTTLTTY